MIEVISGLPDNVLGFSAKGKVTGEDYETVLIPLVEEKLAKHGKIRLLYRLGTDFEGFEAAAMWDDAKVGLHHILDWERIALVSDVDWLRMAVTTWGFVMPGKVKVFANQAYDEALAWIAED